jgi:hypothetical protein
MAIPKYRAIEKTHVRPFRSTSARIVAAGEEVETDQPPPTALRPLNDEAHAAKAAAIRGEGGRPRGTPGYHMRLLTLASSLEGRPKESFASLEAADAYIDNWLGA